MSFGWQQPVVGLISGDNMFGSIQGEYTIHLGVNEIGMFDWHWLSKIAHFTPYCIKL